MLSLKDFNAVKIQDNSTLTQITGGITCLEVFEVLDHLAENNPEQFISVLETFSGTFEGDDGYILQCEG